jgi:hypothetical protein
MAKAKAKKKARVRDLKPRKQVKGGATSLKRKAGVYADPCCGGEVSRG